MGIEMEIAKMREEFSSEELISWTLGACGNAIEQGKAMISAYRHGKNPAPIQVVSFGIALNTLVGLAMVCGASDEEALAMNLNNFRDYIKQDRIRRDVESHVHRIFHQDDK